MKPGRFITLEGGEGVGKSTQSRLLAASLRACGLTVDCTREPGGTPGAEAIRALVLSETGDPWGACAEALLFAAARADHVEKRIIPMLAQGTWVICDRFIDSTRAYQGGGGGLDDTKILDLHRIGSGGLLPDLTILLDVPADVAARRLARRDQGQSDAIGGRDPAYHARVAQAFHTLAKAEPARFRCIAADGTPDETHALIMLAIQPLMDHPA